MPLRRPDRVDQANSRGSLSRDRRGLLRARALCRNGRFNRDRRLHRHLHQSAYGLILCRDDRRGQLYRGFDAMQHSLKDRQETHSYTPTGVLISNCANERA